MCSMTFTRSQAVENPLVHKKQVIQQGSKAVTGTSVALRFLVSELLALWDVSVHSRVLIVSLLFPHCVSQNLHI